MNRRITAFHTKPKKQLKRSGFNGKKTLKKKKTTKAQNIPAWIKAIPESKAHGSGTYQKRLWKLTSDYVRIRDWYAYQVCAATGKRFEHWSESHAGHLKPYTNCNAIFKFDVRNIHMQHGNSNRWGNRDTWNDFEKVVRNRGYDFDAFEKENRKAQGERLYDSEVIEKMRQVLKDMAKLPEQPAYYQRAISLMEQT